MAATSASLHEGAWHGIESARAGLLPAHRCCDDSDVLNMYFPRRKPLNGDATVNPQSHRELFVSIPKPSPGEESPNHW